MKNQPKTPTNPKGSGRHPSDKKMFSFRVEKKHHELLKEIAIYLNEQSNPSHIKQL